MCIAAALILSHLNLLALIHYIKKSIFGNASVVENENNSCCLLHFFSFVCKNQRHHVGILQQKGFCWCSVHVPRMRRYLSRKIFIIIYLIFILGPYSSLLPDNIKVLTSFNKSERTLYNGLDDRFGDTPFSSIIQHSCTAFVGVLLMTHVCVGI